LYDEKRNKHSIESYEGEKNSILEILQDRGFVLIHSEGCGFVHYGDTYSTSSLDWRHPPSYYVQENVSYRVGARRARTVEMRDLEQEKFLFSGERLVVRHSILE